MKGKNHEHTESRETFIKGGLVSIFADTTDEYRLFRFGPFFHKLKLSETESRWKSQNVVTSDCIYITT